MRRIFVLLGMALCLASAEASAQEISSRAANLQVGGRLHSQYSASSVGAAHNDFFFRRVRLTLDMGVTDFDAYHDHPGVPLMQDFFLG